MNRKHFTVALGGLAIVMSGGTFAFAATAIRPQGPSDIAGAICSTPAVPIESDNSYHRAEDMLTRPLQFPLAALPGRRLTDLAQSTEAGLVAPRIVPSNLRLQLTVDADAEAGLGVRMYYAATPLTPDETITSLIARGGISMEITPSHGITGSFVRSQVGTRGMATTLGPFDAALVHADELLPGVRPYDLYWSDGVYDYAIESGAGVEDTLAFAASFYC